MGNLLRFAVLALALAATGSTARAADFALGDLVVRQPWARASIGAAKAGAAYLIVVNHGTDADRLIAVEAPVSKRASLHMNKIEEGVAKMRAAGPLDVAPGAPLILEPGGLHIMLMGLEAPLTAGEAFPLTLVFEEAGSIEIEVEVVDATAAGPADGSHGSHQSHD